MGKRESDDDKTQSSNENNKIGLDGGKALLIKEDDDGKIMGEKNTMKTPTHSTKIWCLCFLKQTTTIAELFVSSNKVAMLFNIFHDPEVRLRAHGASNL